jgi:hypothetical protein
VQNLQRHKKCNTQNINRKKEAEQGNKRERLKLLINNRYNTKPALHLIIKTNWRFRFPFIIEAWRR